MPIEPTKSIWMNGEMIPWEDAQIHVLTHTLHYGTGVFEGIRAYETSEGPEIFRLREHMDRMLNSAKILLMPMPYTSEELQDAAKQVVRDSGLESCYIRPIAYYGYGEMGLATSSCTVDVAIACWPWPDYMDPQSRETGITVRTSSYTRHHVNITMCKAKANGNYINSIMALREAIDSGCDEALLLDNEGYVAEGSGENFFLIKNGVLHTPELTSCLPGITRDTVLVFARELDIPIIERRITRDEVYIADEAFFTGTAAEVLPIRELDGRVIGHGKPGPVTLRLQSLYFDQVRGKRDAHPDWHVLVRGDA